MLIRFLYAFSAFCIYRRHGGVIFIHKSKRDMASAMYFSEQSFTEQLKKFLVSRESLNKIEILPSYFGTFATHRRSSENRAAELIGHLSHEIVDFYFEQYDGNAEFLAAAKQYGTVRATFTSRIEKSKAPEDTIQHAVSLLSPPASSCS